MKRENKSNQSVPSMWRRSRTAAGFLLGMLLCTSAVVAMFVNGGFETGTPGSAPPSPWTIATFLNMGFTPQTVQTLASLDLATGGKPLTLVVGSSTGPQTMPDPDLGPTASLRFPRYGNQAVIINEQSSTNYKTGGTANGQNINQLSQTVTIGPQDIDPADNQPHIRFVVAPVLQNPAHTVAQQPYYFIQVTNLSQNNAILYSDFEVAGVPGVPWKTINGGTTTELDYTDWQLIDIAPGSAAMSQGDQVELKIIVAGCSPGGHFGKVYLDGVGSTVPGLFVEGTAPSAAQDGTNITYQLNVQNGGSTSSSGVSLTFNTPPHTTFQSFAPPSGATCTGPAVGAAGAVVCNFGAALQAGGSEPPVYVTVNINNGTTGTITAGNYFVAGTGTTPLLGPHINTAVDQAGFTISKSHVGNFVQGDASDVFIVSVTNSGFGPTSGTVTMTDSLPPVYSAPHFVSMPPGWTCSLAPVQCSTTTPQPVNQPAVFQLGVSVSANAAVGPSLSSNANTAMVAGGGTATSPTATDAPTVLASTTTSLADIGNLNLSATAQPLTVSATVAAPAYTGNTAPGLGTVTFTARDAQNKIISSTSASPSAGVVSASLTIPALQAAGTYTVTAAYTSTRLYAASTSTAKTFSILDVASNLLLVSGYAQSATVSTAFALPLVVAVKDAANNPVPNVNVLFTAPSAGASGVFSNNTATMTVTTGASGTASAPFTANSTPGAYNVSASVASQTATFTLTNTDVSTTVAVPAASAVFSTSQQNITLTATVTSASTVNAGNVIFTVGGVGSATSGTVTSSAASATLSVPAGQAPGTYSISASYTGAGSLSASMGSGTLTINKQTQTISFASITSQAAGTPVTLNVSSTSGLTVTLASLTPTICTISGMTATLLTAGSCTIQATQPGNANYAAATSVQQNFQVNAATETITFPALPATAVYGAAGPYTLNATASSGLPVSYAVTGPAAISGTSLNINGAGTVMVTASQPGNSAYSAATPVTRTITITQASSNVSAGAAALTPTQGQTDVLSASVTGAGSQPGGTVVFSSPSGTICTTTLNAAGTATCSYVPAAAGSVIIAVQYQGDANHSAASGSISLSVAASYDAAVNLKVSSTQLVYPGATNVVVCITPVTATGTVRIFDGNIQLTTLNVQGGGCAYWYISPGLNAGTHVLTAVYSGDGRNPGGTSAPVSLNVAPVPVNMGVACWNATFPYGANYQCTINISSNAGAALGVITYAYDGGSAQTLPLNGGNAQFTLNKPIAGSHSVAIGYAQQTNYAAAPRNTQTFTVSPAPVNVAVTPSAWYASAGTNLTFEAAVTSWSAGAPNATGSIQFYDGQTLLATVPVNASGQAVYATGSLEAGAHPITAVYAGGTNYASGTGNATITLAP